MTAEDQEERPVSKPGPKRYKSLGRRELRAKLEALAIRYPVEGPAESSAMAGFFHTKRNEGYDDS